MPPSPKKILLHKKANELELHFTDQIFVFSAEFLRVHSPSAEVMGHGPGQETLQYGKQAVKILRIEAAGNYAIKIFFDDGHDSGIFTWSYLHELGEHHRERWEDYLAALHRAGKSREKDTSVVKFI